MQNRSYVRRTELWAGGSKVVSGNADQRESGPDGGRSRLQAVVARRGTCIVDEERVSNDRSACRYPILERDVGFIAVNQIIYISIVSARVFFFDDAGNTIVNYYIILD